MDRVNYHYCSPIDPILSFKVSLLICHKYYDTSYSFVKFVRIIQKKTSWYTYAHILFPNDFGDNINYIHSFLNLSQNDI